jgi:hypothetical protein
MLRFLVLLLLLLNGVYFAYTHDLLRPYGFAPAQQTEPQRVAQQIRPELVRILSADETRAVEAAARASPKPAECLQAGPFDDAQAAVVRDAVQAILPSGSWSLDVVVEPARWIVYMGKFPDAQALARKRAELASLNLRFEPLVNPSLEFGLSLGGYDTEARARNELAALAQRGVRTATVVQERAEARASRLRIAAVDAAMLPKLEELKNALDGNPLRACK